MRRVLGLFLLLVAAAPGCAVDPYCIDCVTGDGGSSDGGSGGDASVDGPLADAGDAGPCIPAGAEVCNDKDDDCDGMVDEGDLPGTGVVCGTDTGECVAGTVVCQAGELVCGNGYVGPNAESCNGLDDDCDGVIDDGDPGGGVVCGSNIGECQTGITECSGGSVICNGEVGPTAELCNSRDDDCDGMFDEGNPEGGAACGMTMGGCMPGTEQCIGGALQCVGGMGPSFETCDGADNDCDGMVDEDFDLMSDPNNCGSCGNKCMLDNAVASCTSGTCTISFCLTGFWDVNTDPADGCEYPCDFAGGEICNGADDDCDGMVDEGLTPPSICNTIGECAGTVASCSDDGTGTVRWWCPYGPTVSTDSMGNIVPETDCDELDNDCDGVADDAFPTKGDPCTKGIGACQTTGTIVCNSTMDGVQCNAPTPPAGTSETCNGQDDDCDGILDEGAPDDWAMISSSLWIHRYEASRPDASSTSQGTMSHRACSRPNVLPWTNVTRPEAEALCNVVGARLCTEAEWQQACRSSSGTCTWSYDSSCSTYQPDKCNGNDYDFDPATPGDQDGLLPTGQLAMCYAEWGGSDRPFDMSGNLKEWTAPRSAGVNPLRGGSYNNTATGISCTFDFVVADDTFQFQNVGFRCCRSTAPP